MTQTSIQEEQRIRKLALRFPFTFEHLAKLLPALPIPLSNRSPYEKQAG